MRVRCPPTTPFGFHNHPFGLYNGTMTNGAKHSRTPGRESQRLQKLSPSASLKNGRGGYVGVGRAVQRGGQGGQQGPEIGSSTHHGGMCRPRRLRACPRPTWPFLGERRQTQ